MTSIAIDRIAGLSSATAQKGPCRVATTANITLSGLQTVDGVALAEGDRVLVRSQSNSALNAIYIASTGDWEIAKDFSRSNDVLDGSLVYVSRGATLSGRVYAVAYTGDLVIGTTAITFTQIYQAGAGAGDMLKANNLSELPSPSTALGNLGGAPLASPVFTGTPTAPTQDVADNSLRLATTAFVNLLLNAYSATVNAALALKATLVSPAFTGSPTAPTATLGDNSTKLATTAFVIANAGNITKKKTQPTTDVSTVSLTGLSTGELVTCIAAFTLNNTSSGSTRTITLSGATSGGTKRTIATLTSPSISSNGNCTVGFSAVIGGFNLAQEKSAAISWGFGADTSVLDSSNASNIMSATNGVIVAFDSWDEIWDELYIDCGGSCTIEGSTADQRGYMFAYAR